ncbi:MAG TPA: hypothetical protein VF604_00320 [Pyrinomonadaceae bacterium]|jgi:hypothetical protein
MRKLFLTLLISIFAAAVGADAKNCSASGRIVDDNGNPVSGAYIYTDTHYTGEFELLIATEMPKEDGTFNLEFGCGGGIAYLWVTSEYRFREAFMPVAPSFMPFAGNKKYSPFAGIPIKGRGVKLGDIKIQIRYRKVKINLQDETGSALFPSLDDFGNIVFKIKNERGTDFATSPAPDSIDLKNENIFQNSSVLMSLPEGRWIVEIKPPRGKGKMLYPDKLIEVKNSGEPVQEVDLRMSRKKINQ